MVQKVYHDGTVSVPSWKAILATRAGFGGFYVFSYCTAFLMFLQVKKIRPSAIKTNTESGIQFLQKECKLPGAVLVDLHLSSSAETLWLPLKA